MKFSYAHDSQYTNVDPEYDTPYGSDKPPIVSKGNLTYLQFIDVIQYLWNKGHPEIKFLPYSAGNAYDPELGYIIYGLEARKTRQNNTKARHHHSVDHPDNADKKLQVFIQSFDNLVKFTAVHKDPRTAEEIIEAFEDFMIEITPVIKSLGIEEFIYNRRTPDEHEVRYGEDLAARSVMYLVVTQKILTIDQDKLEETILDVRVNFANT